MKASLLLLYLRIFSGNRTLRRLGYGVLILIVTAHIRTIVGTVGDVRPASYHWRDFDTDAEFDVACR